MTQFYESLENCAPVFHSKCRYSTPFLVNLAHEVKTTVCALPINFKLLPFPLEKSCKNKQTITSLSKLKAVSTI